MFISPIFDNRVQHQMNATDMFLELFKDVLTNPLVCGGAPRDWFFNNTAKDIDIFVDPQDTTPILEKMKELKLNRFSIKTSEELPENYRSDYISSVITVTYLNIVFQIIVKTTNQHPLENFPCSLVLITYKDFNIQPQPLFLSSIRTCTILFKSTCNQKYERKMIKKFRGYDIRYVNRLIDPGFFENRDTVIALEAAF